MAKVPKALADLFSSGATKQFSKGEIIVKPHLEPQGVYLIKSGFIKSFTLTRYNESNLQVLLCDGEFFPLLWALGDVHREVFYAALTDVELQRVSKNDFNEFIANNPKMQHYINQRLFSIIYMLLERVHNLELRTAKERVVYRLLELAKNFGKKRFGKVVIDVPLTHNDIADSINMSRETASREIAKLERKKIIGRKDHRLVINKLKGLEALM